MFYFHADNEKLFAVALPDGTQRAPFSIDFIPQPSEEGKAVVSEGEDGDIYIEGWASSFDGLDREGENFMDGAFERGLKAFMNTNPVLCYHHQRGVALGQVVEAQPVEGKGLWIKARIDKPEPQTFAADVYRKVKKGTIRALSIGGFFKRKLTPAGWRINDVDFTEISVTPVSMHPRTTFSVVAGKAFEEVKVPEGVTIPEIEGEVRAEDEAAVAYCLERLGEVLARIADRNSAPDSEPESAGA